MTSRFISLLSKAALVYAGYKAYSLYMGEAKKVTGGVSSEAPHQAVDNAEEASMDSFPASDPPAANVFT